MTTPSPNRTARRAHLVGALASAAAIVALVAAPAAPGATSASGGVEVYGTDAPKGTKAKLRKDGTAVAPKGAPRKVRKMIRAANEIHKKPYRWGGGHRRWNDKGYDCSGAISYVLHKAGLLKSALDSSGFMRWGKKGKGTWLTIYAHGGHAYAVIAGLRWDTSMTPGNGPGWSEQMRPAKGFKKRTAAKL